MQHETGTSPKNLLLTGPPGCGKTTVVRRAIGRLGDLRLAGFYTQEIREHGQRVGFEAISLGGRSATLGHVDSRSRHRVGRYGVDLCGFEAILEAELQRPSSQVDFIIIDDVGRMECLSQGFIEAVARMLDRPVPVLATVAAKGGEFIAAVKRRPDVELVRITLSNRDAMPDELARRIRDR